MMLSEAAGENYDPALQQQITIEAVTGGKQTNPAWLSEISDKSFRDALITTLESRGLLSTNGLYSLNVTLVKVDKPVLALNVTVTTHIRYVLKNRRTDQVLLDELVVASSTVKVSDELLGVKRLRVANETSARENIRLFLSRLSGLSVDDIKLSLLVN